MNKLFHFGMGYSAISISHILIQNGWKITGTVRSAQKKHDLEAKGFQTVLFDDENAVAAALQDASHCLISVPPQQNGDPSLVRYYDILAQAPALRWIGYLSTTGVYGNHGGQWIDETTPATPKNLRSVERVKAEKDWADLASCRNMAFDIFRLSGIYGPDRNPINRIKAGIAHRIIKPGQVFNRIHVDDIAQTVARAIELASSNGMRIFNVSDNEPTPPQDVITYAARLLNIEPPPEIAFDQAELSPMARSFYDENKRVRNDKIKNELGVKLLFPTYREGLAALLLHSLQQV